MCPRPRHCSAQRRRRERLRWSDELRRDWPTRCARNNRALIRISRQNHRIVTSSTISDEMRSSLTSARVGFRPPPRSLNFHARPRDLNIREGGALRDRGTVSSAKRPVLRGRDTHRHSHTKGLQRKFSSVAPRHGDRTSSRYAHHFGVVQINGRSRRR